MNLRKGEAEIARKNFQWPKPGEIKRKKKAMCTILHLKVQNKYPCVHTNV